VIAPAAARPPEDTSREIAALIATLERTGQRLEELTGGEVDAVADGAGRTFFLRHTQDGLRDHEARRQAGILNALPANIVLLDANGVIVSANEAWRQFATANCLQESGSAVGVNYFGVCDRARGENSAEAQQAAEGIRSVLAGTSHFALEYPCHSPTEQRWFLMTVAPLAETGAGVVVMHQNITARKLAEASFEALSRKTEIRERMLTTTLSSLDDFAYIFDRSGRFLFANAPLLNLWGRTLDEAIGKTFAELDYPPDLARRLQAQIQEVIDIGQSVKDETPYTSPSGVEGFYEYILSPAFGPDGTVDFVVGSTRDTSERMQAAARLRTSLAEFRQLAESMPQIVWITSADGKNTYFSQQWMDYTGLTLEESLGEGWNKPFHPDDQQPAWEAWHRATTTCGIYSVEARLRRADGTYRWWLVRGVPHFDDSGQIIKWFGTCTDVHDVKVANLELERVNLALKMLSGTNEALFRENHETALLNAVCRIAVEDGGYRMAWIGYAPDDGGGAITPVAHAGAADGYFSNIRADNSSLLEFGPAAKVLATGKAVICHELSQRTKSPTWLNVARAADYRGGICLPLSDGARIFGVLGLFSHHILETSSQELALLQDLADDLAFGIRHKRAEVERTRLDALVREQAKASRDAEERTQYALGNAGVGIWDLDYATGVFQVSEVMEAQLGLTPGEFDGTREALLLRVHPLDRAAMSETMGQAARSGEDFAAEYRFERPDGTVVWLQGKGRVQLGEQGQAIRGVGISLDVSERHRLEEQFYQAQKMEAVGQLAGGVAHDFNNLLTVILGHCELLLEGIGQDDPRARDVALVQEAGTRAAGLTRQLLAFSRKQIIEPAQLDLNLIVTDIQGMLRRLIGEDVKITVALAPDPMPVLADRGQVEQVMMNLAVNARDAMPKGGTLTIETAHVELDEHYVATHRDVKPGPYVVITVTDTGTGMTPAVQARLFEPFFTTKELGKGTGLGMATVYGIVTQSGGSIGVYSELGKGTAFKLYFPRADAAQMVAAPPTPVAAPQTRPHTVLVVEDEVDLRQLTQRLLQRLGHTVLVAADAIEARRLFDQHPEIDLLLTDVVMPGASGPELTNELSELRPTLKVIYMSGYTEDAIVHHGVLAPGIDFLNKPFTSRTLAQKLRDVLDR
jgi:PAS domain S-box-containing protein